MKTKIKMVVALFMIIAQIYVVCSTVITYYAILSTDNEYRFKVENPYYNPHNSCVEFNLSAPVNQNKKMYALIETYNNGLSEITGFSNTKPVTSNYLLVDQECFSIRERYWLDMQEYQRYNNPLNTNNHSNFCATIKIKNGKSIITGFYIDDLKLEDLLDRHS